MTRNVVKLMVMATGMAQGGKSGESILSPASSSLSGELEQIELVLSEYEKLHSIDAVRGRPRSERRFAVATYSCPLQAGNRLHEFLNSALLAVVTNRTLLWQYSSSYYPNPGTAESCGTVLKRAAWIPGAVDFPSEARAAHSVLKAPILRAERERALLMREALVDESHPIDELKWQTLSFGVMEHREAGFAWKDDFPLGKAGAARRTARRLLGSSGELVKAAYGALYARTFSLSPLLDPAVPQVLERKDVFSIAIHSRHQSKGDDGRNVSRERGCLEDLLRPHHGRPCAVCIMSDRNASLQALDLVVQKMGCDAVFPQHATGGSFRAEHGPFAGAGFFQELAVCGHVRHGLIGLPSSSAFKLLQERVAYSRRNAHAAQHYNDEDGGPHEEYVQGDSLINMQGDPDVCSLGPSRSGEIHETRRRALYT